MKNYQKSISSLEKELKTNVKDGLSDENVRESRELYGSNELKEEKRESIFMMFVKEFKDPLIIILLIAAAVSVIADPKEWIESVIILVVVLINAVLGVYQEYNAEKSLEALKKLSSPNAKVIRNGKKMTIPSEEVVVGDILVIEAGDFVASDARIIESHHMQIDESALTGESVPVEKIDGVIDEEEVPLGDQKNMVFASTMCTYGRGLALVTSVAYDNEIGKIASMLNNSSNQTTPLQMELAKISKVIGMMCIVICVVVFGLEMMTGLGAIEAFKTAIALAVAAIPEGLATVVTIVLAMGVSKMVKYNAIVRKLPAVETLGACDVICSDKTGTLTQNKMTVTKVFNQKEGLKLFDKNASDDTKEMLDYFTLCSDGDIKLNDDGSFVSIGDPTETALVYASYLLGNPKEELNKKYPRVNEIAFDSDRKLMTVFVKCDDGILQITKGAPDVVLSRSINKNLNDARKANETMSNESLRVLAIGIKHHKEINDDKLLDYENNLEFVGLVGMIDPPRLEVKDAIDKAYGAGVNTVMITGDHITTAKAIAKDLNILKDGDLAITGNELNQMSDEDLYNNIENIKVYARVAPEHKVRIVETYKKKGKVVAMTGDGVNDSPALKAADIGCAMGITGTDVSKSASDVILTDDNFATIIEAIKQGRGIYSNIKKDVHFLLSSNIGEVVTIFGASLIGAFTPTSIGVPLLPIHLLWVNLITDTLPAFAIGLEKVDDDVMKEKPRKKGESFFANGLGFSIGFEGVLIGLITLTAYLIGNRDSHSVGMTMAFITLVLTQLIHSFNIKSEKSVFNKQIFNNKYLWLSLIVGIALQLVIIYVPFLANIFKLAPLDLSHLLTSVALSFIILIVVEIKKLLTKGRK